MRIYYVYIVANKRRSVLYIGMTNDIVRRSAEHKSGEGCFFTKKYNCTDLIYYEEHNSPVSALNREKAMKKWKREWKVELIQKDNPQMQDLSLEWNN